MRKLVYGLILLCGFFPATGAAAQQHSPAEVVDAYIAAMAAHDASPDLDIYTAATKEMLKNWRVNNGQMDNAVREHKQCSAPDSFGNTEQTLAVVRYGVEERRCNPYFLRFENGDWRLDLASMQKIIQFNMKNQWHFRLDQPNPYSFGFTDWRLDENGYPHAAW